MKHTLPILALFILHSSLFTLPAAVPLRWTVETSRAQVAQFEAYRGETLDLEATMKSYGKPLETPVQPSLYWQTNGMGAAWWTAPATASGNVLRATWSPTNDCGGTVYNCFIGGPNATYRAAFRLRMLPSPGFTPNHIPLPTVKDESDPVFSAWLATNELFSAGVDTNAVLGLITSATNGLATAEDLGGYLKLTGGTLTGDLEVGEMNAASRKLTIAADNGATGITMTGGTSTGNGSIVAIGGSRNRGGTLIVNMGLNYGGRINVLGGLENGRGGSISVTGNGASISAKGTNASIKKGDDEVATEKYVNTQVSGVESTLTTLAGAVDAKADASSVYTKIEIDEQVIAASNQTFSNAVLSVGLNIDTNSVAVLNEIAETFGGFPIEGTATTVGGLLAALAAAVAWLKKNKVQTLKLEDESIVKTAENGVVKVDDFFKDSNSLLNARITYERNATGLKDRAFNTLSFDGTEYNLSTALAAVTPTASGQPRDLLIVATATAATTISFTAGTIKGDKPTIDGAGTWLITLTEYASGVWYCRQIKMEDAA